MPNFPKPSGPFSVGCTTVVSKLGANRSLFRMFYPACVTGDQEKAPWLPVAEYTSCSKFFKCFISDIRMNAILNANVENAVVDKMPVVVFSHGLGLAGNAYSQTCIELASKGMLVAAIEHSDKSAWATYYLEQDPEDIGKLKKVWVPMMKVDENDCKNHEIRSSQVQFRADDCEVVLGHLEEMNKGMFEGVGTSVDLSQFQGRIDVDKAAVMGHSLGGATAVAALREGTKFKLGIGLDAWLSVLDEEMYKNASPVPILFINSSNYVKEDDVAKMQYLEGSAFGMNVERKIVTLLNSNHLTQTDIVLLTKKNWFTKLCKLHGPVDPLVLTKVNNDFVSAFIGKHLGLDFGEDIEDLMKQFENHVAEGNGDMVYNYMDVVDDFKGKMGCSVQKVF